MKVTLLEYTDPKYIEQAARVCRNSEMGVALNEIFIHDKIVRGHHTPFEQCSFKFLIEDVSRVLSHQLVRHRMASLQQESQRRSICLSFTTPKSIVKALGQEKALDLELRAQQLYDHLCEMGVPAEDARYYLPQAVHTKIFLDMNVRSLWHFFQERCCACAQWEIRELAQKMLQICKDISPVMFEYAGPPCKQYRPYCPNAPHGETKCS